MTRPGIAFTSRFPQELVVGIRGPDVLRMESLADPDEEAPLPDLGELFAGAAAKGLFGGPMVLSGTAVAQIVSRQVDREQRQAIWRLRLDGIDPGGFRILWNVVSSWQLDEVSLVSEPVEGDTVLPGAIPDPLRLAYPSAPSRLPFVLDLEAPLRASKDRSVQVVFQHPPAEAVVDEVLAALQVWTRLLMLGGYAETGVDPAGSGAFPDPAFQLDEVTVEQAFPEMFLADEAAFSAVVNHASLIHRSRAPVASVVVR